MSIFDLQKRQEDVRFVLEKRNIVKTPVMRVGVALDVSGSAKNLYRSGVMQATIDRLVPLGMKFDDNGEMDVWTFDHSCNQLASVGKQDYEDFIEREIMKANISKWGSTDYAGPMQAMLDFYFGGKKQTSPMASAKDFFGGLFGSKPAPAPQPEKLDSPSKPVPAMALFITDGACSDRRRAAEVLRESAAHSIYWQLIGVGNPSDFGFLQDMAEELDNVGFVHLSDLSLSDEKLYDVLLTAELAEFIRKH